MINFFNEDTDFKYRNRQLTRLWLKTVITKENRKLGDVNIIFCSDPYLLKVNQQYLKHDYYTDIITFDYCHDDIISGDLFISVDSVRNNSVFYKSFFSDEMHRVIVHGILHLIGYDDHSETDISSMRHHEDFYLSIRPEKLNG